MLQPFEFDGIKSSVYGLYVCNFSGSTDGTKTIGNERTINTVKAPSGKRWLWTGTTYETPLTFTFQIAKYECGKGIQSIEPRELAQIIRWLVRKEYHYLRFEQNGWDNVFYNCTLKVQKYEIGGIIRGLEIEATCDAPWGYSQEKTVSLENGTRFSLFNYSDEDGGLLPDLLTVKIHETPVKGTLVLTNTFVSRSGHADAKEIVTRTEIKNCTAGEELIFDRHKNIRSSLRHETLMDDFNHIFLTLYCDLSGVRNTITTNTPCSITVRYREIRKGVPV